MKVQDLVYELLKYPKDTDVKVEWESQKVEIEGFEYSDHEKTLIIDANNY